MEMKMTRDIDVNRSMHLVMGFVLLLVVLALVWVTMIAVVPAGYVGVRDTFGTVDSVVLPSGIHLKLPITGVHMMSIRTQKYMDYDNSDKATITALSNDGLSTTMGIAVMYHLDSARAVEVYRSVGENYANVVMVNPIHSVPRDLISKYDTKTLYSASTQGSTDRAKIESELMTGITAKLNEIGVSDSIVIEQVSVRDIDFPAVYKDSIANKMKMDTEIQQKELEVKKQEMESNRMRAEAQGIADANKIIANSLTESYLKWYTIEMMKQHTGATFFIPTGPDGVAQPQLVKTV